METEFFQDGGQIKREKDICHHGPKHIPIICQFPDPPSFSLPTTFNGPESYLIHAMQNPVVLKKNSLLQNVPSSKFHH
jgi:hypothetical protein